MSTEERAIPTTQPDVDVGPLRAPLTTTTSIKPAASVLIAAVVMLVVFIVINFVTDQATAPTPTTVVIVGGLSVDAHNGAMSGCRLVDLPPANIVSGLLVPVNTTAAGPAKLLSDAAGSYDCSVTLRSTASQGQILGFYLHQLEGRGWTRFSSGVAAHGGGEQYLFNKAGQDTFYWIEGVTITSHDDRSTSWTVRLYQDNGIT